MSKIKACTCDLHLEKKFLNSLEKKVSKSEFKKLEDIFEKKWMISDDLIILKAKMDETWPGSKYRKAISDMYKLKWIDNLMFVELSHKASQLQ